MRVTGATWRRSWPRSGRQCEADRRGPRLPCVLAEHTYDHRAGAVDAFVPRPRSGPGGCRMTAPSISSSSACRSPPPGQRPRHHLPCTAARACGAAPFGAVSGARMCPGCGHRDLADPTSAPSLSTDTIPALIARHGARTQDRPMRFIIGSYVPEVSRQSMRWPPCVRNAAFYEHRHAGHAGRAGARRGGLPRRRQIPVFDAYFPSRAAPC